MIRRGMVGGLMVAALLAPAPMVTWAAEELPPFWIAISLDNAELDAGPQSRPPAEATEPMATVTPGQTVNLRAKLVGGRRAYMMWPDTYANVGPNTTIEARGFDQMSYTVQTETFRGTGEWTVTGESYTWNTGGRGALSPTVESGERAVWTAPMDPGVYTLTVSGQVKFHFVRQAPGGTVEQDEDSGQVSRSFAIAVMGPAEPQPMSAEEAMQHIITRFNRLGTGPEMEAWMTGTISAGSLNNLYSVFTDVNDNYVCGAWQGRVLDMLDALRNGSPEEKAIFEHYDYGPVHAYYGGHQAVVVYPKGSDWRQTGTVLDPWPNQRPEAYTIQAWEDRFWFGVGPSSVWQGQYPLTGAADYPTPRLSIPPDHMAVLRRLPQDQREQYLALTNADGRAGFIANLPPNVTQSAAVSVQSPVRMLITDVMGRRVGWQDQATFIYEVPGADVDIFPEPDGTFGMTALLPYAEYNVQVTGDAPGSFGFVRAMPATVTASPLMQAQSVAIGPGQSFSYRLSPGMPDGALVGGDGAQTALAAVPVSAPAATPTTGTGTTGGTTTGGGTTTPPPATGAAAATGVTITTPREGDRVQGRVEVRGTGRAGALIVVSTEVHAQDDDELLRDVPGSRHRINDDGTWQVWVAAPVLPANIMEPLYYVLKAQWVTADGQQSEVATVRLYRAQ